MFINPFPQLISNEFIKWGTGWSSVRGGLKGCLIAYWLLGINYILCGRDPKDMDYEGDLLYSSALLNCHILWDI